MHATKLCPAHRVEMPKDSSGAHTTPVSRKPELVEEAAPQSRGFLCCKMLQLLLLAYASLAALLSCLPFLLPVPVTGRTRVLGGQRRCRLGSRLAQLGAGRFGWVGRLLLHCQP